MSNFFKQYKQIIFIICVLVGMALSVYIIQRSTNVFIENFFMEKFANQNKNSQNDPHIDVKSMNSQQIMELTNKINNITFNDIKAANIQVTETEFTKLKNILLNGMNSNGEVSSNVLEQCNKVCDLDTIKKLLKYVKTLLV
jgi:hypothetical protein